ncbi:MAG: phage holin, lambda family [Pontibacterium sp.]
MERILQDIPPWFGGLIMAVVMSAMRVVYDRQETSFTRIVLESLICGALTVAAGSALNALGFDQNWYLACGGFIGFMGSQSIRAIANSIIRSKL